MAERSERLVRMAIGIGGGLRMSAGILQQSNSNRRRPASKSLDSMLSASPYAWPPPDGRDERPPWPPRQPHVPSIPQTLGKSELGFDVLLQCSRHRGGCGEGFGLRLVQELGVRNMLRAVPPL